MKSGLIESIKTYIQSNRSAGATSRLALTLGQTKHLAQRFNVSRRQVEITALENGVIPERYSRNFKTLTAGDQIRLLKAHVGIVGLGGLGGAVVDILARMGVGTLTLVDGDVFEDGNLNRQLLSSENLIGRPKAQVAAERVGRINSAVTCRVENLFLTAKNAAQILDGTHLIMDCLDNVPARFTLEDAARAMAVPLVSAAVGGVFGQITTVFPEDRGLAMIYGERHRVAEKGIETDLGNLPTIVYLAASLECAEAINVLLDKKNLLRNRLRIVDLDQGVWETLSL